MAKATLILTRVGGYWATLTDFLTYTGPAGELNSDGLRTRLQDGVNPGGIVMARGDDIWPASPRLSLTSGTLFTTADVAAATTVYCIPCGNDRITLYNGTFWQPYIYAQLSAALDATNYLISKVYPLFLAIDPASTGTVVFGSGPAWTSDTNAGAGAGTSEIELFQGRYVNKNSITLRNGPATTYVIPARRAVLVGGIYTTAAGQTEDSAAKRMLSNVFNIKQRSFFKAPADASWNQTTASGTRQANGNAANQVEFLRILSGEIIDIENVGVMQAANTGDYGIVYIGLDSTVAAASQIDITPPFYIPATKYGTARSRYTGSPAAGRHTLTMLEAAFVNTVTWLSSRSGLIGSVPN